MRKVLIGLFVVVVMLVGAALVVPGMIDWNAWKGDIADRVEAATGRRLAIDGNLEFSILPTPRLAVNGARLANIPGAGAADMVSLKSLGVRIKFAPLLRGRIEVESVTLVDPVIRLEKLADGRVNWEFAAPEKPTPAPGLRRTPRRKTPTPTPSAAADAEFIRLDSLRIINGTLIYRDAGSDTVERIERFDAEISAGSLAGPFRIKGSLRVRQVPLALEAAIGRIAEGAPTPISLRMDLAAADARIDVSGTIADIATAPRMSGRLKITGSDFARFAASIGGGGALAGPASPPWLAQKFTLDARVRASAREASATELRVELGDVRATGTVTASFGERIRASTRLRINRIDLDRWLAMKPRPRPAGSKAAQSAGGADRGADPDPPGAAAKTAFSLPREVDASLDLSIAAVKYLDGQIRDLRLAVALNEGEVTLNQATARLPGGAEASLFGFLTARGGSPNFDGSLEARADNLRTVLQWLKIDVSSVPADRLRKFSLTGKLKSDGQQMHLLDAKIELDTSRIRGGVTFALQDRLAFGVSINLDHLNLDAYLPSVGTRTPDRAAGGTPGVAPDTAPPAAAGAGAPLAVLNDFDANLRLRIGSLTYRRTAAQGISFDGTLAGGKLTLRRAGVRNLGGTKVGIEGTLTNFDRFPVFKGTFDAESKDLTGLARIAGVVLPIAPRRLGAMKLTGRADASADTAKLRVELELAGARLKLAGDVVGLRRAPRFTGNLNISHPEFARLLRTLGHEPGKGVRRLGAFGFSTTINGDLKTLKLDARAKAVGASVALAGSVSGLAAAPRFDLELKAGHPSFGALIKSFDPAYRATAAQSGPVSARARIRGTPTRMNLDGLAIEFGDAAIAGTGTLTLDGVRPKLSAKLTAGELTVDPFLAPFAPPDARKAARQGRAGGRQARPPGGAGAGPASGAARFSSEPIDLSALAALDAEISLSARALSYRNFRVDKPVVKLVLKDRVLTVSRLAGRMFDGSFNLTGSLDATGEPRLDGMVKVDKANVGKALFEAAQFDILGGVMDFEMTVKASGRSQRAMVAGLNGNGRIAVRNGVVQGFNLRGVSDRLKNIDRGLDILRLFGAAMGGGSTPFSVLDGSFRIENGVLTTNDLRMLAEAGEGRARGSANLPRWTMDFIADFRLTEHPKTPPFGMEVKGPIDNPKRIFRFQKLQAHLLQRGLSGLLRRALPQQQQPAQQQTQPRRPRPEDILRGLLDGLRR